MSAGMLARALVDRWEGRNCFDIAAAEQEKGSDPNRER
jgi:hypothetical protein